MVAFHSEWVGLLHLQQQSRHIQACESLGPENIKLIIWDAFAVNSIQDPKF